MTSNELVLSLRKTIITDNIEYYKDVFENTKPEMIKDRLFFRIYSLYQSLSQEQRSTVIELVRQVQVDTLSNFLGILDGSSTLSGYKGDFLLAYYENEPQNIQNNLAGDLQDIFLEIEEEGRVE